MSQDGVVPELWLLCSPSWRRPLVAMDLEVYLKYVKRQLTRLEVVNDLLQKSRQRRTAWILVASFTNLVGTPTSRVCRAARLAGRFLWLLSSTLAFGQNSPMLSPTALEPRADSALFHASQTSSDQVHNRFSTPFLQLLPLHHLSAVPAEETGLFSSSRPHRRTVIQRAENVHCCS